MSVDRLQVAVEHGEVEGGREQLSASVPLVALTGTNVLSLMYQNLLAVVFIPKEQTVSQPRLQQVVIVSLRGVLRGIEQSLE